MASLFTKIINGEIPAKFIHQDEICAAIHDIQPQAPIHILIFPKKEIINVGHSTKQDQSILGHLLFTAAEIARALGLANDGYRIVINNGKNGGQSVDHLHVHLLAGRQMQWPPG